MACDGSMTLRDLIGQLGVPHVECLTCDRHGRYRVDQLAVEADLHRRLAD
jgi:hypothetical protein